jgi:hypothetical protein
MGVCDPFPTDLHKRISRSADKPPALPSSWHKTAFNLKTPPSGGFFFSFDGISQA